MEEIDVGQRDRTDEVKMYEVGKGNRGSPSCGLGPDKHTRDSPCFEAHS